MENLEQTFKIKNENGEIKEAELINVFNINDNEYAIYCIDNGNETSNLYASKIVIDDNGQTQLIDLKDNNEKIEIINIVKELLNK